MFKNEFATLCNAGKAKADFLEKNIVSYSNSFISGAYRCQIRAAAPLFCQILSADRFAARRACPRKDLWFL